MTRIFSQIFYHIKRRIQNSRYYSQLLIVCSISKIIKSKKMLQRTFEDCCCCWSSFEWINDCVFDDRVGSPWSLKMATFFPFFSPVMRFYFFKNHSGNFPSFYYFVFLSKVFWLLISIPFLLILFWTKRIN